MALRTLNLSDPFAQWKDEHNNLATDVGDLSLLGTIHDSDIVSAINGLDSDVRLLVNLATDVGDITLLQTTQTSNVVAAINSLDSDVRLLVDNEKITIYDQNGIALN